MAMQLNPYLTFLGTTREAMTFYAEVLGGTVQIMTFRDSGLDVPGVMHASLETPAGFHLYASDQYPGMGDALVHGNNIQLSISGDQDDALRSYWEQLSVGGQVVIPLQKQIWGDIYGMLVDRYGISWHINISDPAASD